MAKEKDAIPQYRIGDYAHYLGVTPDFLKHYEQYRLVSSFQRESGYRYYPFSQSFRILECMRLKGYGFPIRDIEVILNDDDAPAALEKMNNRIQALEKQISREQALIHEHHRIQQWFRQMNGKASEWQITTGERMLFLPHTSQRNFLKDPLIYEILGQWMDHMPIVKSCMLIPHNDITSETLGNNAFSWGLVVPASYAEEYDLPINQAVREYLPRKLFIYHFADNTPKDYPYADVLRQMQRLNLSPTGDTFMTMQMYTHIYANTRHFGYFSVPID